MPCDLCRKLSFCVYFLLTSASKRPDIMPVSRAEKNTAHSGIHRRTFGRFKNVIFIQRVKIIDIQVFALLLFDRRTTEQILRRRPGRSRPGSQFGIVASLTLFAMLCASLRLHPLSSPTGGGGLRRCSE